MLGYHPRQSQSVILFSISTSPLNNSKETGFGKSIGLRPFGSRSQNNRVCLSFGNLESLKYLPKLFTIKTKNESYHFHKEFLKDSSETIDQFLKTNPDKNEYQIDPDINPNVLENLEEIFNGKEISFDIDDITDLTTLKAVLGLRNFPVQEMRNVEMRHTRNDKYTRTFYLSLSKESVNRFINRNGQKFTIKTESQEYKCSYYGPVLFSDIIGTCVESNPALVSYEYNSLDETDNFKYIIQLFNLRPIEITIDNMESLKSYAEELGINSILPQITEFITKYNENIHYLDQEESSLDDYSMIFTILKKIGKESLELIINKILEMNLIKTKSGVEEISAAIYQYSLARQILHPIIVDLVVALDEKKSEEDESRKYLKLLLPTLIQTVSCNISKSNASCSLAYELYKRNIFTKDELIKSLSKMYGSSVRKWFAQEISEVEPLKLIRRQDLPPFPDRNRSPMDSSMIKHYNTMRETGSHGDAIIEAIKHDNLAELKNIINETAQFNFNQKLEIDQFFEDYEIRSYIDFAAYYGAIECFKYIQLNKGNITDTTFLLSVYGENPEIIHLAHQKLVFQDASSRIAEALMITIAKYNNELFDWILENMKPRITEKLLFQLLKKEMHMQLFNLSIKDLI